VALLRLAAWQAILAAGLAAFLVSIAVVDATGPRSCGDADSARQAGLLANAEKGYAAILGDEPNSTCAQDGMRLLAERHCDLADDAEDVEPVDRADLATAKKEREAALKIEPRQTLPNNPPDHCAIATTKEAAAGGGQGGAGGG
jgi:hypothetical protein